LSRELSDLGLLVAGDYIKRAEFDKGIDKLYEKLDDFDHRIMVRFDGLFVEMKGKMDRSEYREKVTRPE
jgi:hypothetical protein